MRRVLLSFLLILVLSGCASKDNVENDLIDDARIKSDVVEDVKLVYEAIYFHCANSAQCDEGEEFSINDVIATFDSSNFNMDYYDLDYDSIIGTYTEDAISVHLEANGDNLYEYDGIVHINSFQKSDLVLDED